MANKIYAENFENMPVVKHAANFTKPRQIANEKKKQKYIQNNYTIIFGRFFLKKNNHKKTGCDQTHPQWFWNNSEIINQVVSIYI